MFVSMGPFVPDVSRQEATPVLVGGFYSQLLCFIFRACLAALVGLLLAVFPFFFFLSLSVCLFFLHFCK